MVIDTFSNKNTANSFAKYLHIFNDELYDLIISAYRNSLNNTGEFDIDKYNDSVIKLISNRTLVDSIDEIYVYHLTRRLTASENDNSSLNLKDLLLTPNAFSDFLIQHDIKFHEIDNHPVLIYNGNIDYLSASPYAENNSASYLKSRLGYYEGEADYCFNGFVFFEGLINLHYSRTLSLAPEFISMLSEYLNRPDIISDYERTSRYYCYIYKFPIDMVLFDINENMNRSEKISFFTEYIAKRTLSHILPTAISLSDNDNPIIRLSDDVNANDNYFVNKIDITNQLQNN